MIKSIQNRIVHAKRFSRVAALLIAAAPRIALAAQAQTTGEPHGWPNTETLKTRVGEFEFKNGYPTDDTAQRLRDLQTLNRATEVYLTQIMRVGETAWREGMRAFGSVKPQQVVIWEKLLDPQSLLLTSNAETVYAVAHLRPNLLVPRCSGQFEGMGLAFLLSCRGAGWGLGREGPPHERM
jgi:hypothetical protein